MPGLGAIEDSHLSWPGIAVQRTACFRTPMSRPSTSLLLLGRKTWMPGARPGMTAKRQYANATHHPASAIQHSLMAGLVPASQITDSHFKQPCVITRIVWRGPG